MEMGRENKPKCILHIGMPKTGSTSIQITLSRQEKNSEYEYIVMGDGNNAYPVCSLFSLTPHQYHGNKDAEFNIEQFNQHNLEILTNVLTTTEAKVVIISSEDICHMREVEIRRIQEYLDRFCSSIHVVAYVRPYISYMQSALQQVIKQGVTDFEFPNYRYKFEKFDNVFGSENVELVKFDPSAMLHEDVIFDFCQRIGITIDSDIVIHENSSVSLEAVSLLYAYHKLGYGYGFGAEAIRENEALIEVLSNIGKGKLHFSADLANAILKDNLVDIEWMEERLGTTLLQSPSESPNSISSLDDLLTLGMQYSDDLKKLLFSTIQQQVATPKKVAEWMHLLRMQLVTSDTKQISPIYSAIEIAQLEAIKTKNIEFGNILKDVFFLTSNCPDFQGTLINLRQRIMPFLQSPPDSVDGQQNIHFSIDLFKDGYIMGWIVDKADITEKLNIELYSAQGKIGEGIANQFRADLVNTVSEDGCCAFSIEVDPSINTLGEHLIIYLPKYDQSIYVNASKVNLG